MRGAPLFTQEEFEAGEMARDDAARDHDRDQAWRNYDAASPKGDVGRQRAFNAGFAAGIRHAYRRVRDEQLRTGAEE